MKVDPLSIQYRKTVFGGKEEITYDCPGCKESLRSPLSDAGNEDHCPHCECDFVVPGEERVQEIKREQQEQKKTEQRESENGDRKIQEINKKQREQEREAENVRVKTHPRSTHYISLGLAHITSAFSAAFAGGVVSATGLGLGANSELSLLLMIMACFLVIAFFVYISKARSAFRKGSDVDETSDLPNRFTNKEISK